VSLQSARAGSPLAPSFRSIQPARCTLTYVIMTVNGNVMMSPAHIHVGESARWNTEGAIRRRVPRPFICSGDGHTGSVEAWNAKIKEMTLCLRRYWATGVPT
jgi:hypothetical protein